MEAQISREFAEEDKRVTESGTFIGVEGERAKILKRIVKRMSSELEFSDICLLVRGCLVSVMC